MRQKEKRRKQKAIEEREKAHLARAKIRVLNIECLNCGAELDERDLLPNGTCPCCKNEEEMT